MRKSATKRRSPYVLIIWSLLLVSAIGLTIWLAAKHRHATVAAHVYREPDWLPPVPSNRWTCIVIHHSASEVGGAGRFDKQHRDKGWDELGYHFVIGNGSDTAVGQVEVGPRWLEQKHGAHCKTDDGYFNQHGIGICLVGNFENHRPDPAQLRSLARLVRYLQVQFHIPEDRLYTHGGVTGKTLCPGSQFDLAQLKLMLKSL